MNINEQKQTRLLLVEDDVRLAGLIADYIGRNGFLVTVRHRGDEAVANFEAANTDIITKVSGFIFPCVNPNLRISH